MPRFQALPRAAPSGAVTRAAMLYPTRNALASTSLPLQRIPPTGHCGPTLTSSYSPPAHPFFFRFFPPVFPILSSSSVCPPLFELTCFPHTLAATRHLASIFSGRPAAAAAARASTVPSQSLPTGLLYNSAISSLVFTGPTGSSPTPASYSFRAHPCRRQPSACQLPIDRRSPDLRV
jgi:hypothetical protein